jgi:hypothetical protein
MASGSQGPKQSNGYFVPLGDCVSKMLQYKDAAGAGGSFLPGNFTPAGWAASVGGAGALLSTISSIGQGGLLKDMGKTVVSSNRTFRKVQLVTPALNSKGAGLDTTAGPYYTGYVELSGNALANSGAAPAPVAYLPGLLM